MPFASGTFTADETSHHDVHPVEELEVGVEWAATFRHFGAFVRTGLVGQIWFDSGNATDDSGNLGFFGLALTGGLDF